jgi:TonB family protein
MGPGDDVPVSKFVAGDRHPADAAQADGPFKEAVMIRQLFASAGGVPEGRRTNGAAPFSVVLHAAAIGALLFFSQQKVSSHDGPPPRLHFQSTPTPAPQEVKVALKEQPRGAQRPAAPQKQPLPSGPTATPFVEPPTIPDGVRTENVQPGPTPAPYVQPGCVGDCPDTGGPASPGPGPAVGPDPRPGLIHVAEASVEAPHKTHDVAPIYPEPMRIARLSGIVHIECVIAPDGRVRDARVVDGNSIFAASAIQAVRQWVYTPSKYNGQPVSVVMTVTVRFVLKD